MTNGLLNFLPNAVGQGQSTITYAEVTSPAPAKFSDPLYVVEPDWTIEFSHGIPDWPACHGVTLPLVGDAVLVVHDSRGNRRCVWWDGQMTFSTQTSQAYYLTTTASDVADHKQITPSPFSPKTPVSFSNVANGQVLLDYVTPPGLPGGAYLPAGQFEFHVHALQYVGNEVVRMYAEFWEYDPNTATHVAMIGASAPSKPLTVTEVEYRLFFSTNDVYAFVSPASRIVIHVHALVGGTGGASVRYFVGGGSDSHVVVPVGDLTVPGSAWTAPSLINSWANVGGAGIATAGYLKDHQGFVRLKGRVKSGTSGSTAFVLPTGFRPGATDYYAASHWSGSTANATICQVDSSGNVVLTLAGGGVAADASIGGISFLAEN